MEQGIKKIENNNKKYPEGHFMGMWMVLGVVIFSGLGIPLSITTGNSGFIGVGPAIGITLGLSIGSAVEAKYKKEGKIRPLTEKEKKRKKIGLIVGVLILVLLSLLGLILFLSRI